jgi:hypothetical protein
MMTFQKLKNDIQRRSEADRPGSPKIAAAFSQVKGVKGKLTFANQREKERARVAQSGQPQHDRTRGTRS